ncbi:sensor histidine kinase [Virgisporangium aurantiacum]|uniref:histidine kinase n=1 Tax=Virgisporangium aurantiacum TaxID=175570 RepID=A0A8J4DWN6_9ACTN|nr:sensor histidine kinase [Virgisporangium aurantiacum]GIJ52691.1 two-component sensor histidine kinase [Virgisporangium aurantiacum]
MNRQLRPLAGVLGLVVVVLLAAVTAPESRRALDVVGVLLLVTAALATAAAGRAPVPVLAVTTVALLAYQARGYPGVASSLPVIVALYMAVRSRQRWAAGAAVTAVLVGGYTAELATVGSGRLPPDALQRWMLLIGWMVAACVAAELVRQLEQRALDAERTREETARRRADEERLRIARELHDSLTHSISLINVQAGVAVHLARKRSEEVPPALLTIQETSREAMRELRATLEVLRADPQADGEPATVGLSRLDGLVEGAVKAGVPVRVTVSGERRDLPPPVDRTAYRIVQEALTNVTRHAGPATASVHVEYRDGELAVQVDDDGRGGAAEPGVGLTGMRERVAALGGSLHFGPRPDAGFSVRAVLPVEAAA